MKSLTMVISCLKGGGAERVASLITNAVKNNGYESKLIVTCTDSKSLIRGDLQDDIPVIALRDSIKAFSVKQCFYSVFGLLINVVCKLFKITKLQLPSWIAYLSFICLYHDEIHLLRKELKKTPDTTVLAFLQPAIPIALIAARNLPNRVIISERGDPRRLLHHRYGGKFLSKYYQRADAVVFQTEDAKATYPEVISKKGTVICNPVKSDLPEPYKGERNKYITTFCRIARQKNLPLLLKAFKDFHEVHGEYVLKIIGDANNSEGEEVKAELIKFVKDNGFSESVVFEPFRPNVHEGVKKDAMFVSSSDYEGISNAMLEAMAIGMPVICTDCPIGGARQTIKDGYNGLLVPIKDEKALTLAMRKMVEEDGLKERLGENASKVREEMSLSKIAKKWMDLF